MPVFQRLSVFHRSFVCLFFECVSFGIIEPILGPVVQSVVSSLRTISLTILADSIYNFLILFAEKMSCKSYSHFFSKTFQHICVSLDVNFNESLTNDVVSFEQLGPAYFENRIPLKTALGGRTQPRRLHCCI